MALPMNIINDTVNCLEAISLNEMDNVKLMDRIDSKYIFTVHELPKYLSEIKDSYRVLEVNNCRMINYESLYFDTIDFTLYHQHHNGKMNRHKIRFRKYIENNLSFFEIKHKNNKVRTQKNRISCPQIEKTIVGNSKKFLGEMTNLISEDLLPVLWVIYTRITLVNRFTDERVTIDTNLSFKNSETQQEILNLVIAEVKQDKAAQSAFSRVMKNNHIREGFMSKYCFGISSLYTGLRKNNFKPQFLQLKKLQHATPNIN